MGRWISGQECESLLQRAYVRWLTPTCSSKSRVSSGFCWHLHSCTHTHTETQTRNLKINIKKTFKISFFKKNPVSSIHDPIVLHRTSAGHILFMWVKTDLTCRCWIQRSPLLLLKLACLSSQRLLAVHPWNVAVPLWWSGELWQDMPCWHP